MTTWIRTLTHGVPITDPHWETESYGENFATQFTVAMQLVPWHADLPGPSIKLDRELMYSAMVEFCRMVEFYGALQGEWEYWAWGRRLAFVKVYVWQWPKESEAEEKLVHASDGAFQGADDPSVLLRRGFPNDDVGAAVADDVRVHVLEQAGAEVRERGSSK
ncbi:MAG: hypothetical protein Q9177_001498 [Variospora cf. flavescens]